MNHINTIIIGCGPAGISTAIYLKRYGYNPLIIAKDYGSLAKAHNIENYYGIESISGLELAKKGVEQAKKLGIEVIFSEVVEIEYGSVFGVKTKDNLYKAETIVLALGASHNTLGLATKFEGVGVSYCATCDGFFFRKKKTALIGSGEYMLHEYSVLEPMIKDITIFTNGEELTKNVNCAVVKEKIKSFNGDEHLESITTIDGKTYPIDGAFIAMGTAGAVSFARHLGLQVNGNYLQVNEDYMTNIKGIYAVGDCVGGLLQVSKAVGDGSICATAISKYLKNKSN